MLLSILESIEEAQKELYVAQEHEKYAEPAYIDAAIEATNIARARLENLYKRADLMTQGV